MKASLISKIIVGLCVLCLVLGLFKTDKHKAYNENQNSNKNSNAIVRNINKVAVLELEGAIASSYESSFFSKEANASNLLKSLTGLNTDDEIKGVIIKINSPGGTVAMSQNIYNQIMKLRQSKPVVVVFDDIAASGGYYIASAADRIIAQEGTLTGSIGVIFSIMDYHNLLADKLSINPVVIKSGKFKDIGSGSREMTAEEHELLQNIVDNSYNQFLNAIINGRVNRDDNYSATITKLDENTLRAYADGRVFTGIQAKELGFVDEIGDIDTATTMIKSMLNEKLNNKYDVKLITYSQKTSLSDYLTNLSEYSNKSKITEFLPTSMILSKRPLYLWE